MASQITDEQLAAAMGVLTQHAGVSRRTIAIQIPGGLLAALGGRCSDPNCDVCAMFQSNGGDPEDEI
ncbi:MAG: hypothetical protein KC925_01605 [Candidatus Doudnabacteria bacterium]|nr:hypothetical protein [Candidatus Doudnabacteria bacterium]